MVKMIKLIKMIISEDIETFIKGRCKVAAKRNTKCFCIFESVHIAVQKIASVVLVIAIVPKINIVRIANAVQCHN